MSKIANFIILIILFSHSSAAAQARLGVTFDQLKSEFPELTFEYRYSKYGEGFATTHATLGLVTYYFDKVTELSNFCFIIPEDPIALSVMIEGYNKKYVILSETDWIAYLPNGKIIKITLRYDEGLNTYLFYYRY